MSRRFRPMMRGVPAWGAATPLLLAALFLLILTGCFSDGSMQGGDDYPNSVEPLGKHAAQERNDSSAWNAYKDAPASAPGMYDSTQVPENPPSQNTPKRGASIGVMPSLDIYLGAEVEAAQRSVQFTVDTASGVMRAVRMQQVATFGFSAVDTTWYKAVGPGFRLTKVSGQVSVNGDTRYSSFEDGDGDGYLSAVVGSSNVVRMTFITVYASGEREVQTQQVGAGPDANFNTTNDNTLMSLGKTTTSGLDTLLSLVLRDADSDGVIFNPLRISNNIEVESKTGAVEGRTDTYYSFTAFADSTRNFAYRYRRTFISQGRQETVLALGRDSLPDFRAGDSGSVRVSFSSSLASDTLASSETRYGVVLSTTAGGAAGNRLIAVDRDKVFRLGSISALAYRMQPDEAVSDGDFARTGSLFVRVDLRAGGWVQFEGQAAADISGTVTDSQGKHGTVHFNFDGTVQSASGF